MTKDEFLKRIQEEKPDTGGYGFIVDDIVIIPGGPALDGCKYENGKWKIYSPYERGGITVFFETDSEDEAFNKMYENIQAITHLHKKRVARTEN